MAENKMTKEVLKAAKGTRSVEELQKLAKENGMELDAVQCNRWRFLRRRIQLPEMWKYGGFFQRAALWLHLCNLRLLRCNLLGSYFHQNTELIDFGWRDIFDGRRNNKKRAFR